MSCGTDDTPPPPPATTSSPTPSERPLSPKESIISSPVPTAAAPEDPARAEEEIRESWARFFSPESSVEDRADVAENGGQYQLMIEALAKDRKSRLLRVRVDSVTFVSDLRARVGYTLFSDGRKVGPENPGESVRQDDTWKVTEKTVCSLTKYGTDVPQAPTC
ncbi:MULTISPECIES: hypothetical protein [unclassified Streptomyces]|uniref:hypothetical protein n=1 Tax=unclassified Streptomyces TaxID=2593676 RepID=UPI002E81EB79|nr:hypothetical protein [Streptomyces sp. NBC_00589]WTI35029.1 hypothetical protein OIC96_08525 [Streptomyces sp. NBC_00775]WUB31297.1 hypothetical protein OHA51_41205 [Streptomyces sp. NBC_00589]